MTDKDYRQLAKQTYAEDGILEIDDDAPVSVSEDRQGVRGAYVQAWVWVDAPPKEDA